MISLSDTGRGPARLAPAALAGCVALFSPWIPGCGESENDQPSTVQRSGPSEPQPPPEPEPEPVDVESLVNHELVQFPQAQAPTDESLARAVVNLASAIASGDAQAMRDLLDSPAQAVLEQLVDQGRWGSATSAINVVRVCSLQAQDQSAKVGLGIEDNEGAYLLAWEGRRAAGRWRFTGLPVPEATASSASELDGVSLASAPIPTPQEPDETAEAEQEQEDEPDRRDRGGSRRRRSQPGRIGPGASLPPSSPIQTPYTRLPANVAPASPPTPLT